MCNRFAFVVKRKVRTLAAGSNIAENGSR